MVDLLRRVFSGECARGPVLWAFGIYTVLLLGASLIPGADVPNVPLLSWDKAQHALAFAVYGGLAAAVCGERARWALMTVAIGIAVGALSEGLQALSPGRQVSAYDFLADLVGVVVAVVAVHFTMRGTSQPQTCGSSSGEGGG